MGNAMLVRASRQQKYDPTSAQQNTFKPSSFPKFHVISSTAPRQLGLSPGVKFSLSGTGEREKQEMNIDLYQVTRYITLASQKQRVTHL